MQIESWDLLIFLPRPNKTYLMCSQNREPRLILSP